ncbi:MAG: 50S ribosomal protein L30 [Clostridia bacterium]|nr:50S ribosomal protein L30 [Clostridia bacterium]
MSQVKYKITLIGSAIGCNEKQKRTLDALGLRKINQSVIREDSSSVRGMINKLRHLLSVEELDAEEV